MGRKSALSPEQWAEVEHRHIVGGESINALAKEFDVNESSIRRKISKKAEEAGPVREQLHEIAARKVRAEKAVREVTAEIEALPVVRQMIVSDLARKLSAVTNHISSSSEYLSAAIHRTSGMIGELMDKVDPSDIKGSSEVLTQVKALAGLANELSHIPLNVIKANQATLTEMNKAPEEEVQSGLGHFYGE